MLTAAHKFSGKIATEVKPFTTFYPAEDYHQEFIKNNPNQGYVRNVSIPDYIEFQKLSKDLSNRVFSQKRYHPIP